MAYSIRKKTKYSYICKVMPPSLEVSGSGITSFSDFSTRTTQAHILFGNDLGTSYIKIAGATNNDPVRLTNLATPASITDACNKEYVDAAINGLHIKVPVRYASNTTNKSVTTDVDLSAGKAFGGVDQILIVGDRVLLMAQTNKVENGIWEITVGVPVRPVDFTSQMLAAGVYVFVDEGELLDRAFICITDQTISEVDTNELTWVQFSARPLALAGIGLGVGAGENQLVVDSVVVPYLANNQTFTGNNTFTGAVALPAITGMSTPLSTDTNNAANVGYVNSQFNGFSYKAPVDTVSTTPIDVLTITPDSIMDGYTLLDGSRVLLAGQEVPSNNGVYRVTSGGAVRSEDLLVGSNASGLFVIATNGTMYGDQAFICTNGKTDATVGTHDLQFTTLVTQSSGLAGQGLIQNGRALDIQVDNVGLEISGDTVQLKDAGITDSKIAATTITNSKLVNSTVNVSTYNGVVTTAPGTTTDNVALGTTMHVGIDYAYIPGLDQNNTFTATNAFGGANTYTASNTFSGAVSITSDIPATSQVTGALVVTGGVGISGDLFVSSSYNMSDEHLKTNIKPFGDAALDIVNNMRGCSFNWNNHEANEQVGRVGDATVGVIAQEVVKAGAPLCVIKNKDNNLLAVDYTKIVPYLIESVKSLKRKCEFLDNELCALRCKQ
jgi:hypothetical protein